MCLCLTVGLRGVYGVIVGDSGMVRRFRRRESELNYGYIRIVVGV